MFTKHLAANILRGLNIEFDTVNRAVVHDDRFTINTELNGQKQLVVLTSQPDGSLQYQIDYGDFTTVKFGL